MNGRFKLIQVPIEAFVNQDDLSNNKLLIANIFMRIPTTQEDCSHEAIIYIYYSGHHLLRS